jgi:hypothetical protein
MMTGMYKDGGKVQGNMNTTDLSGHGLHGTER